MRRFLVFALLTWAPALGAVEIGRGDVPLDGPWRFHTGDDPRWADPAFDDSAWELVDLTPPPGAHDGDVGLPGYVPGWRARGHADHTGFAWYRLRIAVQDTSLAIAGPLMVDSAYELYVDGKRLGGTVPPRTSSILPAAFPIEDGGEHVIAIRTWMSLTAAVDVEGGGIHIAPTIGTAEAIDRLVTTQWLKIFAGYVVDAAEPLALLLLATLLLPMRGPGRGWMALALVAAALVRAHQILMGWTQLATLEFYEVSRNLICAPLSCAAWVMAWSAWSGVRPRWFPAALIGFTLAVVVGETLSRPWLVAGAPSFAAYLPHVGRWGLAALLGMVAIRRAGLLPAILLNMIVIVPAELSQIGVPGIWFPYGVGVSRTQYALAGLIVVLFVLFLRRLGRDA